MLRLWQKRQKPAHKIDEATKQEVLKLLAGVQQSRKSRFPMLTLMLRISSGYAAMALLTMAALTISAFSLYNIYNTARQIAYFDLPVVTALNKVRNSILAQENFLGKYAILKDPTFAQLFRQRHKEISGNFEVLETTISVRDVQALKRLYLNYQATSERLFAGSPDKPGDARRLGLKLLDEIDSFSSAHQGALLASLTKAERVRQETMKWTVIIACCGFVVAIVAAAIISYRIFRALRRLQTATRHVAAGDYSYDPMIPVGEELSDLASDFKEMAEKLQAIEEARRGDGKAVTVAVANEKDAS